MNTLLTSLLLCVVIGSTTGYWLTDEDDGPVDYSEDDEINNLLDTYKRAAGATQTRNLCIPWRAPCTLDNALLNKYSFLKCCNDGVCKCNLWGNNCRCEAKLGR